MKQKIIDFLSANQRLNENVRRSLDKMSSFKLSDAANAIRANAHVDVVLSKLR